MIPNGRQEAGLVTAEREVGSLKSESTQVQDPCPVLLQAHKRTCIPWTFVSGVARNSALANDMDVSGGGVSLPGGSTFQSGGGVSVPGGSTWESEPNTSVSPSCGILIQH